MTRVSITKQHENVIFKESYLRKTILEANGMYIIHLSLSIYRQCAPNQMLISTVNIAPAATTEQHWA